MEINERHIEMLGRIDAKVDNIDKKIDSICEAQQDHEDRIRHLEHRDAALAAIDDHEVRLTALEQTEHSRSAVQTWKTLTYARLVALLGAAGGAGGVVAWALGLLRGV